MKKKYYTIVVVLNLIYAFSFAQKIDYNVKDGYVAEGYDVVAYFNNKAVKGNTSFVYTFDGVKYKFHTSANLDTFKTNPKKYIPQYGGWCAYAVGVNNGKVSIDPKTFEIRNGKLYLFYNSWGINTLKSWIKENPEKLIKQADVSWEKIKYKK